MVTKQYVRKHYIRKKFLTNFIGSIISIGFFATGAEFLARIVEETSAGEPFLPVEVYILIGDCLVGITLIGLFILLAFSIVRLLKSFEEW